jgi:hypothetical protein
MGCMPGNPRCLHLFPHEVASSSSAFLLQGSSLIFRQIPGTLNLGSGSPDLITFFFVFLRNDLPN